MKAMIWLSLLWAGPALAVCAEPYDAATLRDALDRAEAALMEADIKQGASVLNDAGNRMTCLDQPIDRADLARFGRAMALLSFFGQDEFAVIRYGRMATLADPEMPWPDGLGPDHPLRETIEGAPAPVQGGPGEPLAVPRKGAFYMNGAPQTVALAPAEVPQLVQVFDRSGELVAGFWQDGAAFSDRWIGEPPPEGLDLSPQLAAGGGLVLASALLYAGAAVSAGGLERAETEQDLTRVRSTTNLLVLTSGAAFVGGAGLVGWGVLLDGRQAGIRIGGRF